jgi:phosphatidylglycerophosphate synthase
LAACLWEDANLPTVVGRRGASVNGGADSGANRGKSMLDRSIRQRIDPWLDALGRTLAGRGIHADQVTWVGLALGLGAAGLISVAAPVWLVLFAFLASRICDGLDGAVAKASGRTDFGGFLDIVSDFAVYGAIPLAYALRDPASNALPAAVLLFSFYVNGTTFLAFAAIAARRGEAAGGFAGKAIVYTTGLAEATETILALAAMILFGHFFAQIAYGFAAICFISAAARTLLAHMAFR